MMSSLDFSGARLAELRILSDLVFISLLYILLFAGRPPVHACFNKVVNFFIFFKQTLPFCKNWIVVFHSWKAF